jgi:hypothetical protein
MAGHSTMRFMNRLSEDQQRDYAPMGHITLPGRDNQCSSLSNDSKTYRKELKSVSARMSVLCTLEQGCNRLGIS